MESKLPAEIRTLCPICKGEAVAPRVEAPWAIAGYWRNVTLRDPALADEERTPPPVAGQRLEVLAGHPFHARAGEHFWTVHAPVDFSDEEELLDRPADVYLVEAVLDPAPAGAATLPSALVASAFPIDALPGRFPLRPAPPLSSPFTDRGRVRRTRAGDRELHWSAEGDVGGWMLIRETHAGVVVLVEGEWGFEGEKFQAGCLLLGDADRARLDRRPVDD